MKKKISFLITLIFAVIICYPATKSLMKKNFFHTHDYTHVARLSEMHTAIFDGHFPVRWSKNFGFGYGMPLFNFYGPLPYYIAEIIHLLGFSFVGSIKAIIYLNFIASFMAMFYLAKYYWGKWGGYISATAAIYVPYRAVNTYVRGSINELAGITFTIISLYAINLLMRKNKIKWVIFSAFSLSAIILSHNITALISFPIIFLFAVFHMHQTSQSIRAKKMFRIIYSFILSIGLSAFYAIPALVEKSHTAINKITSGYFHYSQHFLYLRQFIKSEWGYGGSIFGLEDDISFEIGRIQIVLALIGASTIFHQRKRKKKYTSSTIIISSLIIVASMFMATFKTKFIWDNFQLLQYVQFPWRFLSIITIFISLLAGGVVVKRRRFSFTKLPITIGLIISIILLNKSFFQPEKFLDNDNALYYSDEKRIQKEMSGILPDYIPETVDYKTTTPPEYRFSLMENGQEKEIKPIINRTHEFLVETPIKENSTFVINIFNFPGWKFYINDKEYIPRIGENLPVFYLDLDSQVIQTDKAYISGIFTETPIRQISNIISITTLLIISYLYLNERFAKSRG
ncbi:6-pyruvoyl-tetrahydropterin synthase-related protein [Patescibacteria group bacterium]